MTIFFCLFTLTFLGHVPVSSLIPYTIKFVESGFTEPAAFEKRIPRVEQRFTAQIIVTAIGACLSMYRIL
jgi:hypothetical protein